MSKILYYRPDRIDPPRNSTWFIFGHEVKKGANPNPSKTLLEILEAPEYIELWKEAVFRLEEEPDLDSVLLTPSVDPVALDKLFEHFETKANLENANENAVDGLAPTVTTTEPPKQRTRKPKPA